MRDEDEQFVSLMRQIIRTRIEQATAHDLPEKREKQAAIERSVSDFQRLGVSVPGELTGLLEELKRDTLVADEALEMLRRLRSIFADLLEEISAALPFDRRMERPRAPSAVARGFILDGTHYPVDKWIDLLRELLRILASRHPEQLHLVLALGEDRLRPPFTRDPSALNRSEVIPGTDIYMNLQQGSTGRVTDLAIKTAGLFGYGPDRFAILEPD